jgi:4-amino-4-deoxy-L-arabinose transferase-like glycosyltransferase
MLDRLARSPLLQLLVVAGVAALVYLPFLGTRPLDFSEGHRAVPGWTMLESHDYWHIKMFGLTYFRKPPGMPWAIALSSAVFGETTFGARFPSALAAICMSVLAWWYGRRWFGGSGGLVAGLAQALFPLMWSPGRTAEIEMLNNLGTQMCALGLVDVLVWKGNRKGAEDGKEEGPFGFLGELVTGTAAVLVPIAGIMIAGLAKGPASAPVLGGVLIGACIATRSLRTLGNPRLGLVLILAGGLLTLLGMKIYLANSGPDAVREDVAGQFLWSSKRVVGVLSLVPMAFASALPASLALPPKSLWRKPEVDGNRSAERSDLLLTQEALWRALAWAWLVSVGVLVLCGVSNARYAMPAAVLLPPLAPLAAARVRSWADALPSRRRIVGTPLRWALLMVLAAWWFMALTSVAPTEDQQAGKAIAHEIAQFAKQGELWADDAIEARPDILWLAQREAPGLRIRWAKWEMSRFEPPPPGVYLLLRTDSNQEVAWYFEATKADASPFAQRGTWMNLRQYRLWLVQVLPPPK